MKKAIYCLLGICLLYGCEFNTSDTEFTEVAQRPITDYSHIVFADTLDTVIVEGVTRLGFELDFKEFHLYSLSLFVNSVPQSIDEQDGEYSYLIVPEYLASGENPATLQATISTNTGSLADNLNSEAIVISRDFILFVKR